MDRVEAMIRKRRIFVAVEIPPDVRSAVARLCGGLDSARWANPGQFHLTLQYVGHAEDDALAALHEELSRIDAACFELELAELGTFPPLAGGRRPKVLWIRPEESLAHSALHRRIEAAVKTATGIAGEKVFAPHVTLARFRRPPSRTDLEAWLGERRTIDIETFRVDGFHLYDSELTPAGAVHRLLRSYVLQ